MPSIQYERQLFALREGDNLLGADPRSDIRLPLPGPGHMIGISVESIGCFVWLQNGDGSVTINGRPLDGEAVPLFHGDRLDVSGSTLVFIEDGQDLPGCR